MLELRGKYNTIKVYTDALENTAMRQLLQLANLEIYKNNKIRIMPDCHAGEGCVVGTTIALSNAVTPNLVGVDIGCGVLVVRLKEKEIDLPRLDNIIRKYVPSGGSVHDTPIATNKSIDSLACLDYLVKSKRKLSKHIDARVRKDLAQCSLGTLGGGNHFIEVDKDEQGNLYLVIHTGSRHLGIEICDFYQAMAWEELKFKVNNGNRATKQAEFIESIKKSGRAQDIEKELKKFKYIEKLPSIPYDLAYCEGSLFDAYLHDMGIVQEHSKLNRATIAKVIMEKANLHEVERFETIHNYIDIETKILRKGSVSAQHNEKLIIPMNMRDGSLICVGKGNPDWNYSAPHGAGRLLSRSDAKASISLEEYKKTMAEAGIYSTSVNSGTLDESPMAYKPIDEILKHIGDTVEVKTIIKPIYNFKASSLDSYS